MANDYYIRNDTSEKEFERVLSRASKERAALIKILSKGGEGKSTFLHHIAKTYYDSNVIIWLENPQPQLLASIEEQLQRLTTDAPLIFLLDNASLAGSPLSEFAQKLVLNFRKRNFVLVIAEREFRYRNIEDVEDFEALFNETHTINFRSVRVQEQVFDRLISLLPNSHTFSEEIRSDARQVFLEDSRKSLTERTFSVIKYLKLKDRLKGYKFDWDDWETFTRSHAPRLEKLYLILSTFYQFGFSLDMEFCASLLKNVDFIDINSTLRQNTNLPIYRRGRYLLLRHETLASWYLDASDEEKRNNRRNSEEIFKLFLSQINTDFPRNLFIRLCIKNKDFRQSYLAPYVDDDSRTKILEDFIKQHPTELKCRTELSKIYQKQKRWKEAEDILLECLKIDIEDLNSRTELSKLYQSQDKMSEAEELLQQCLSINPNDPNSLLELGKIRSKDPAKYGEAEQFFQRILDTDPDNLFAKLELAFLYRKMGRWPEREKILFGIYETHPEDIPTLTALAQVFVRFKKYRVAIRLLESALELRKSDLQTISDLIKIHIRLRDKENVSRYLKLGEEILERDTYSKHKERFSGIIIDMDDEISLLGLNEVGILAREGELLHIDSEGISYTLYEAATVNYKARVGDGVFFALYRKEGQVFADFVEPFFDSIDHLEELK